MRSREAEEKFLASLPPERRASAEQMNREGEEIARDIWPAVLRPAHDHYILDDNNVAVPVGLGTWAVWFEVESRKPGIGRRRVGWDEWDDPVYGHAEVSTVFLGLDHSFGFLEGHARQLFETMAFWSWTQNRRDQQMWRYPTHAAAVRGHAHAVQVTRDFMAGKMTREEYDGA